jgi:hypothetical protein
MMWPKSEILALLFMLIFWNLSAGLGLGGSFLGLAMVALSGFRLFDWLILLFCLLNLCISALIRGVALRILLFGVVSSVVTYIGLMSVYGINFDIMNFHILVRLIPILVVIIYYAFRTQHRGLSKGASI